MSDCAVRVKIAIAHDWQSGLGSIVLYITENLCNLGRMASLAWFSLDLKHQQFVICFQAQRKERRRKEKNKQTRTFYGDQ